MDEIHAAQVNNHESCLLYTSTLNLVFDEISFEMGFNGEKYELILTPEGDKLLFRILNSGDYAAGLSDGELRSASHISEKGLRYDLTVPFARYGFSK